MAQDDFSYETAVDAAGLQASVSIFSDQPAVIVEMNELLAGAGFRVGYQGRLSDLLEGGISPLGDVVLIDCPETNAAVMAALSRLDSRIARAGCSVVAMTTLSALDDIFVCFGESSPQILVDASHAEIVVAVGRLRGQVTGSRVRELSREDRLSLLRLSEQVDQIAKEVSEFSKGFSSGDREASLEEPKQSFKGEGDRRDLRSGFAQLPDPALVRKIIARRQARARYFDADLFADPAWDMLLDLTAAHAEHNKVSVTSLCIASGVPATTALRWIGQMTKEGLLERVEDPTDRRRAFIGLSKLALEAMSGYFSEIGEPALAYAA